MEGSEGRLRLRVRRERGFVGWGEPKYSARVIAGNLLREEVEVMPVSDHEAALDKVREERDDFGRSMDKAVEAYRKIASKLESGYSFCHPENDCEGMKAWLKASGERDELLAALFQPKEVREALADRLLGPSDGQGGER